MIIMKNKLKITKNFNEKEVKASTIAASRQTAESERNHFLPATSSSLASQASKYPTGNPANNIKA